MLPARLLDPQHTIEEQFLTVGRGQTFEAKIWSVHKHFTEFPHF
jgi:hypothetical protein